MRSYTCSCASEHRRLRASAARNTRFNFAANLDVIREGKGASLFSACAGEDLSSLASLFLEGIVCFDAVGWTYEELVHPLRWEEEADPQTP